MKMEKQTMRNEEMQYEGKRLGTFKNWPQWAGVWPTLLARAGFYYMGTADQVACFCCSGRLKTWEAGDSPLTEHKRFFPQCKFVTRRDTRNVPLGEALVVPSGGQGHKTSVCYTQLARLAAADASQHSSQPSPSSLGIQNLVYNPTSSEVTERPVNQPYTSETVRLSTFGQWPHESYQSPEALAGAGFFYTGTNDSVQCFSCGRTVSNWEMSDVPQTKHLPSCDYVNNTQAVSTRQTHSIGHANHAAEIRQVSTLDALRESIAETRHASTAETRHASTAETRHASTAETRHASTAETRHASTAETRHASTAETRHASTAETRHASIAETRHASTAESRHASTAESRHASSTADTLHRSTAETLHRSTAETLHSSTAETLHRSTAESHTPPSSRSDDSIASQQHLLDAVSAYYRPASSLPRQQVLRVWRFHSAQHNADTHLDEVTDVVSADTGIPLAASTRYGRLRCEMCFNGEVCAIFIPCGHQSCCLECATQLIRCAICNAKIEITLRANLQ